LVIILHGKGLPQKYPSVFQNMLIEKKLSVTKSLFIFSEKSRQNNSKHHYLLLF